MLSFGFWGGIWLSGEDILVTAPRADLLGFTKTLARWGDAERGIHAALVEVSIDRKLVIKI